ncbi:MAG: TlpA family protein disulfide reductase [bacterium]
MTGRGVASGLLAAVVALALAACGASSAGQSGTAFVAGDGSIVVLDPTQRQPAPALAGPTLEGGTWDLADHRGEVVVLNVWASWCAPCRAEAPVLQALWEEFEGQGVQFVGLDTRDAAAPATAFVERYGITYPNLVDTSGQLQLLFGDTLPPQAIPSTLLVDQEGRVAARVLGKVSEAGLRALIDSLLDEQATT